MSTNGTSNGSTPSKTVNVDNNASVPVIGSPRAPPRPMTENAQKHDVPAVHQDLENGHFIGTYGGDNAAYHGLAGLRAGVDMSQWHKKKHAAEFQVPALKALLDNPETQKRWGDLVMMDPWGMTSSRPTIAATPAYMSIPELQQDPNFEADGTIVRAEDKAIRCVKCAVDWVWNLPRLAHRLNMNEQEMRTALANSTQNERVLDTDYNTYLPPVGGGTVYFIGDIAKLQDKNTEVAVRVHDSCCGSDVFGTDICTCRPYLIFALQAAVQCAQRGGVGIIIYFRKEGRSLGEVTKFRVYNARKRQVGGDRPEMYFAQTEAIAGIRDARFQEMMPDILVWLGINRIDWLLSMSSDKFDGIAGAGIEVMQRVPLPDVWVPKNAQVEISAKISAGYHTDNVNNDDVIGNLRALEMVRERCTQVFNLAQINKTKHFVLDLSKLDACADYVAEVTKSTYGDNWQTIPYHSRWRHFDPASVQKTLQEWPCDTKEKVRRMIDLASISVFLDAGAGSKWHYIDENDKRWERSEGLAVASFDMFKSGIFSSDAAQPNRVNSVGLRNLSLKQLEAGFHVSENNQMVGLEGRYRLLKSLGKALDQCPEFFGAELARPGNMVDYVLKQTQFSGEKDANGNARGTVSIRVLWRAVIEGFESIWPERAAGVRRGDVWCYTPLKKIGKPASDMIPFHKLSQWLTYSLLEPFELLNIHFTDMNLMTGLAEYRNGGLFIDTGVLTYKKAVPQAELDIGSELVVEWRALTVVLLDMVADAIRKRAGLTAEQLPLAKVLQGGTWNAGRLIAQKVRGDRSPPITIRSDGTVF